MEIINSSNEKTIPSELFHYTSQKGLLGILESNTLWTSKNTCLNDSSEFKLALDIAKKVLFERKKAETSSLMIEKIDTLIQNIETIRKYHVYV